MRRTAKYCGTACILGCVIGSVAAQANSGEAQISISRNETRPGLMSAHNMHQVASKAGSEKSQLITARRRPAIAVDIDETLSITDYTYLIWGIGSDDSKPLPGAPAALRRIADTYDVVYVTARSRSLAGKTERWLKRSGFPKGRLVTSPTVGDFIFQSGFKRRVLGRLRSEYPNLVAGIGDKASDAKAYRANRMLPIIVNPWPRQRYRADDVVLRDWAAVSAFFENNHDLLGDADGMRQSLDGIRGQWSRPRITESNGVGS